MKVFHKSIYILICLFSVTVLFSQNNEKNSSGKRTQVGAIIGGDDNMCAGSQTQFSVSNLSNHAGHSGNWSVSNKLVATVSNNGLVTALRAGIFILKYDSDDSNCKGDSYRTIVVNSLPSASVTGPTSICINGITTLFPIIGGTWSSSNSAVATVNNLGIVKGISAGSATFIFTRLGGCSSEATSPIVVNATAKVEVLGESTICINETTTLSPTSGGTWSSSNSSIATVSNSGIVKGISPGSATFTFTKAGGCASAPTSVIKVNPNTAVSVTGANVICINGTTTLSPTAGGTWNSSNTGIATVNSTGIVKGLAAGRVTFTFTKTDGCISLPTSAITVNDCPVASITGPSSICINGTTTLSPTTGGTWTSSNKAVATVTNLGIVKGISSGTATFTYTKTGSCNSLATPTVTVSAPTAVSISGANSICINATTTLSPAKGGTWSSSNVAVATVNNDGIVKGISSGTATFTFTNAGGCISPATSAVTVNPNTTVSITGSNSICINDNTTLSPTTGGTWTSSDSAIATVNNNGIVKGVSVGTATFTFTKTGGCASLPTSPITVNPATVVSVTGSNVICENETTTLSPITGGTWASNNPAIATVNNSGLVTGVSAGSTAFTFTKTGGCASLPTSSITVNASPIVGAITGGSNTISVGSTTQFINSTTGGIWSVSNETGSATISVTGLVTGVTTGTAKINYMVEKQGCKGSAISQEITINPATVLKAIAGPDTVLVSQLSNPFQNETSGGVWTIKNGSGVATITSQGVVQGTKGGTVEVVYTFTDPYGVTISVSKEITIISSCTANNSNSLVVQKLFQNLIRHLYNRVCKGDALNQINGSAPAELINLKPYIKNSVADKIYNFSYLKTNENGGYKISFSFSPESISDVVYSGVVPTSCPTDINIVTGLENLLTEYNSYNTALHFTSDNGEQQILFEVKNIDFCPNVSYTPVTGNIISSIEKPTTSDTISFSFKQEASTFSAKKSSSLFSASSRSISYLASTLTYKWFFHELDNVTIRETITDPVALQRFSIPGNYRITLIVKDENGFETTFYRDVIVTQTCERIVGKIIILN